MHTCALQRLDTEQDKDCGCPCVFSLQALPARGAGEPRHSCTDKGEYYTSVQHQTIAMCPSFRYFFLSYSACMQDTKAAQEVAALQAFHVMLGQDSARAFYGPGHVRAAHELGAIQTLLISDTLFRVNDVAKVGFVI